MQDTTFAPVDEKATSAKTFPAKAYSARSATFGLGPASIQRRAPQPQDVQIEILYCGVCHSDLHQVRNEWASTMPTIYPLVPGHEIVGRVVRVGSTVKKFKEGDLAAVSCMVGSSAFVKIVAMASSSTASTFPCSRTTPKTKFSDL